MIKVSVLYPNKEGKSFDMDYYLSKHLPLVSKTLGTALQDSSYEKGLASTEPDTPARYVAIANLYFKSMEEFGEAFEKAAPTLMADLPNFTDIEPVGQISEIVG
ncbi:EthD family reductase [Balneolaceae bacterium YR4-1]|uniref:EthD family reductase n=2 Tax=Halalkalibaculum roseum TaxID=2709311 RepID=A0A6M1SJ89_9BACT|nr:EthD family reductase [Halalkalibaculum roseum]